MSNGRKILIIHDRFQFKGGAERLVLILANALKADLITEFWTPESFGIPSHYNPSAIDCGLGTSPSKGEDSNHYPLLSKEGSADSNQSGVVVEKKLKLFILDKGEYPKIVWRYFRAHFNFIFKTRKIIRQYDTVIFSGNNCLSAAVNCKRGTRKIFYCHSPVRHVFDLWKLNKSEQKKAWKRIIYYNIGAHGIKFIYWLGLKMMNVTIANSENIKNRLWRFSHHKTDYVIYPPIDTEKFKWLGQGDYYFSWGRLERLKRIPDIVSAFQKMPDKKLVVVSGGPDLEKVRQMAVGHANIKIVGWVSDEELKNYLGNCLATIYIPIDEDFGMSPVESMAAGKPCLGVAEGGLLETIIDEKTGKFVPAKYTIDDIVSAVNYLTPEKCLSMRADCEAQAQKFSKEKFIEKMKEIVEKKVPNESGTLL
ncbi:MAG: glycosyltransferase [Patescibacteria group bacterium]|nr:glycosyltransferase [Patescibacteria group bacterium]